jgi:2-polyprenyl-6-methoxyphenol hydroxylase-like FAD-dependent oxidoreductase
MVTSYEYEIGPDGTEKPLLRLADGTKLQADLVIGAGGLGSLARATVDDGEEGGKWEPTGMGVLWYSVYFCR